MNAALAALLFETFSHADFTPLWTALLCGFAAVGLDGEVYLTEAGGAYLAGLGE